MRVQGEILYQEKLSRLPQFNGFPNTKNPEVKARYLITKLKQGISFDIILEIMETFNKKFQTIFKKKLINYLIDEYETKSEFKRLSEIINSMDKNFLIMLKNKLNKK